MFLFSVLTILKLRFHVDVRLTLRIHVEPIEVELDQDSAILITTLQSALPGAFGLYFYDNDCKSSLKFDGKRFLPPGDGWKDRKYYASLGKFLLYVRLYKGSRTDQ